LVFCIAALAVAAGIGARFERLDHTLAWQDEAFSMLRITGHTQNELYDAFDGRVHAAAALFALDRLAPGRGIGATLASLREEPQRGPLFYLVARLWAGAFGDGLAAMRVLPALLGAGGIGLAFLLGRRLSGGALGGAVLAALVAVSPIETHVARQLREYVALADAILLASWLLVRALERRSFARWAAYAASVALGLYVSPIFAVVLLAHAATTLVAAREAGRGMLARFALACAAALVVFAPWALASAAAGPAHAGDLAWLAGAYTPRALATKWAFNIGAVFFDAEFARTVLGLALGPIFAIVVLGAVVVARSRAAVAATLAFGLIACALVPLVALDAVRHARFEGVTRYQISTWLGIDVLVALALARLFAASTRGARALATVAFAYLVACGIFCAGFDRRYAVWWDDNEHIDERLVASAIVSAGDAPALVAASKNGSAAPYALVLSRYLPPETTMLLYDASLPPLPPARGPVFLFVPQEAVVRGLERALAPRHALRDVSPPLGYDIPSLRSPAGPGDSDAIRPANTLWRVISR
jgi:uncharacterized membrane protein